MASANKRNRAAGANPLKKIADWLFKPTLPAYEDRPKATAPKKRKTGGKPAKPVAASTTATAVQKKKADKTSLDAATQALADRGAAIGFVDKKGNVRANAGNRILGKTQKGNKQAALAEFVARFDAQKAQAEALGQRAKTEDFQALTEITALRETLKSEPGLGDDKEITALLDDAEGTLDRLGLDRRADKQALITAVEALPIVVSGEAPDWVKAERALTEVRSKWKSAGSAGPLHDTSLERRFEAATDAFTARKATYFTDDDSNAAAKRQVIAQLKRVVALTSLDDVERLRDSTTAEWSSIGPASAGQDARLAVEFKSAQTELMAHYAELLADRESDQEAAENQLTDLAQRVERAATDMNLDRADATLNSTSRQLGNLARDIDTSAVEARLDEVRGTLDEKLDVRASLSKQQQGEAKVLRARARQLAEADKHGINWKEADEGLKELLPQADALTALSPMERKALVGDLRDARRDMQTNRTEFFEGRDRQRDENLARKRTLINDLPFYPNGARAAELQEHINTSFEAWRKVGSAGRDHDDPLWEEYRTARQDLFDKVRDLRALEKDDFAATLAYQFQRKKEELYRLEGEIGREEMLAESTSDKDKAAKLLELVGGKRKRIQTLERDIMQLQRKLAKLSDEDKKKRQAAANAAPSEASPQSEPTAA